MQIMVVLVKLGSSCIRNKTKSKPAQQSNIKRKENNGSQAGSSSYIKDRDKVKLVCLRASRWCAVIIIIISYYPPFLLIEECVPQKI